MSDNFWWTGATAVGTWLAAGIVAWYAWETKRLREIASDQLEAAVAPLLLLSKKAPTTFPVIRDMDLTLNRQEFPLTVYNAGKGTALRIHLRTTGLVREDCQLLIPEPNLRHSPEEYELSPIPAGTAITISLPLETLARIATRAVGIDLMWLEFELVYRSTSGQPYRSFVKTQSLYFDDAIEIQHETPTRSSQTWVSLLQAIRRGGQRLGGILTGDWGSEESGG